MNKGLLSVDEALSQMLANARPVREIEEVPTLEATKPTVSRFDLQAGDVLEIVGFVLEEPQDEEPRALGVDQEFAGPEPLGQEPRG